MLPQVYSELSDELKEIIKKRNAVAAETQSAYAKRQKELEKLETEYATAVDTLVKNKRKAKMLQQHLEGFKYVSGKAYAPIRFDISKLSELAIRVSSNEDAQILFDTSAGMLAWLDATEERIESARATELARINNQYQQAEKNNSTYDISVEISRLKETSSAYSRLKRTLEADKQCFGGSMRVLRPDVSEISIGCGIITLPPVKELASLTNSYIDFAEGTAKTPVHVVWKDTPVLLAEYTAATEMNVLSGITNVVINSAACGAEHYEEISLFDPVRFNSVAFRPLDKYCGDSRFSLTGVPASQAAMNRRLESLLANCISAGERGEKAVPRMLVFHNFPDGYESETVSIIKRLTANAEFYGLNIILTHLSGQVSNRDFAAEFQSDRTVLVTAAGNVTSGKETGAGFEWYAAPQQLPDSLEAAFRAAEKAKDTNSYETLVGFTTKTSFRKGSRRIQPVPYGKDESGKLLCLDLEERNFATFICGASRSSKSTLLHTIITGILKNTHPDDIELWLVDFKMTEFSRYTKHLPPHVRYIVLDEAPELVYDIVDRLYEILMKRQAIFKNGRWEKLSDVPATRYMPAMLIIIDEFSVMSEILAQSMQRTNDNYQYKMQLLMSKGAAVGMHFIFASQGFSTGTRGLTDMAKNQIAQRVAMKTPISEIRQTLDIKDPSETDTRLMEELTPHHALVRGQITPDGNRLLHSKVLYIENAEKLYTMIDGMNTALNPVRVFEPNEVSTYISKKPLILDGNIYLTFEEKKREFRQWLKQNAQQLEDAEEKALCVGIPQRLTPFVPLRLSKAYRENILIIAPTYENETASSVITSIARSMTLNRFCSNTMVLSSERCKLLSRLKNNSDTDVYTGLNDVCTKIHELKDRIARKKEDDCAVVLLGFESLLLDMTFITNDSAPVIRRRSAGQLDAMTELRLLREGKTVAPVQQEASEPNDTSGAYDARQDLKYILTNGPRLGYHFVMYFSAAGDIEQTGIDDKLFKHKICFRAGRRELSPLVGAITADKISELPDRLYFYTDGITNTAYRPLLHPGLSWDGWYEEDGHAAVKDDLDEYLL